MAVRSPLQWETPKVLRYGSELATDPFPKNVGGIVQYPDQSSQAIYLLDEGMYVGPEYIENTSIISASSKKPYWNNYTPTEVLAIRYAENRKWHEGMDQVQLSLDAPSDGRLYMAITLENGEVELVRNTYALDISPFSSNWSITRKDESPIVQLDVEFQNMDYAYIANPFSAVNPGNKVELFVRVGGSEFLDLGTMWIDEVNADILSDTADISCRNACGFYLKSELIREPIKKSYTDLSVAVKEAMSEKEADAAHKTRRGNSDSIRFVTSESYTLSSRSVEISKGTSVLDAITNICDVFSKGDKSTVEYDPVSIFESGSGIVYVGRSSWLKRNNYRPNGVFHFDEGSDVFEHKITKLADNVTNHFQSNGKNDAGENLTEKFLPVTHFAAWNTPKWKYISADAPCPMTSAQFEWWTNNYHRVLSSIGVTASFVGRFSPELLPGDTVTISKLVGYPVSGVVTEVKHTFDLKTGFRTEFSISSGGYYDTDEERVTSVAMGGFNRSQNVIDIVRNNIQNEIIR